MRTRYWYSTMERLSEKARNEELLHNCEVYEQIARSQLSAKELGLSEEVK